MLRAIFWAGLLTLTLVSPASGQPNGVLTQASAKALVHEFRCYSMHIAAAQTVLLKKWFRSIGATDQEFTEFQVNVEAARRQVCGEVPASVSPLSTKDIFARFRTQNGLSAAGASLTLQESLARYTDLVASRCSLPTQRDLALSFIARMRTVAGSPTGGSVAPGGGSPTGGFFGSSLPDPSTFLGNCSSGGGAQVPDPGADIGSFGNTAKDLYGQCVRDVIAAIKPAECAVNPRASGWRYVKYAAVITGVMAGVVAFVATLPVSGPAAVGAVAAAQTGVVVGAGATGAVAGFVAAVAEIIDEEIEAANKKAEDARTRAERDEAEKNKKQAEQDKQNIDEVDEELEEEAKRDASTPGPTTPARAPQDDPKQRCNRFPVSGAQSALSFDREDGGVIDFLDSIKSCRCKAIEAEAGRLGGIRSAGGTECQSEKDRRRADCLANPFDDVDRPREECIQLLMEDNSDTVNIEALLCSQVRCTQYGRKVGMSADRTLACGCLGPGLSTAGSTRTTSCQQMRCEGKCVCRGTRCTCEGSESRVTPTTPPSPPFRPVVPERPPGVPQPPFR
jgi:hypothetical protein